MRTTTLRILLMFWLYIPFNGYAQDAFITVWKTNNVGTSTDQQIIIPAIGTYDIYWEDTTDTTINGTITSVTDQHMITFPNVGTYRVSITGGLERFFFNNDKDKRKIIDIEQWGTISWTSMLRAFEGCPNLQMTATDAPDLSNVTSMSLMFMECFSFNGAIGHWDVSNVTDFLMTFRAATSFNQDLSNWDTSSASTMGSMFNSATRFNQNIGDWDISNVSNMTQMLRNSGLSIVSYDATLKGWAAQTVLSDVTVGARGLEYCSAENERNFLIDNFGWTFVEDSKVPFCPFVTTWKTDNTGTSGNDQITIPAFGTFDIFWEDVNNLSVTGNLTNVTGPQTITFPSPGMYQVYITGGLTRIEFDNGGDKNKLLHIDAWGDVAWSSMENAFEGCINLSGSAVDVPDLSQVSSMSDTFKDCWNFDGDISDWNVSTVTNMYRTFIRCATFNTELSGWDVSNVSNMERTFFQATAFDQNLGSWNVSAATNMTDMLDNSGLSVINYDETLMGWASQSLQINVTLGVEELQYCRGESARSTIISTNGWNVNGDSKYAQCDSFVTVWKTDNVGDSSDTQITIPAIGTYDIYWEDVNDANNNGTITSITGTYTLDFGTAGTYRVGLSGGLQQILFDNSGDKEKILLIENWGSIPWASMANAFYGCSNLTEITLDEPDLSNTTTMEGMFREAGSLTGGISEWNVSTVTNMTNLFNGAINFNEDITGWDVSNVTHMDGMFSGATSFNQDLNTWVTSNLRFSRSMFSNATSFNGNIGNWTLGTLEEMSAMFSGAISFDQDISGWNTSNVRKMDEAFSGAIVFDQDIGAWDVSNVTDMQSMLLNATEFSQDLGGWNINNVTNLTNMLDNSGLGLTDYDATLIGWATQNVQSNVTLGAMGLNYCEAATSRDILINTYNWNLVGDTQTFICNGFITTWKTDNPGNTSNTQIKIPARGGPYNIYWEQIGNLSNHGSFMGASGDQTLDFGVAGTYKVWVSNGIQGMEFSLAEVPSGDNAKIIDINQWGNIAWTSMRQAFQGCANLQVSATDAPDLSGANFMTQMFKNCSAMNSDIGHWNVSNVTSMTGLFEGATNFNQDISDWNVGNVRSFGETFQNASSFNQDISGWNTAKCFRFTNMFNNASAFDQNLGTWNMTFAQDLLNMFDNAGLSTANYDATLQGWASQALISNRSFGADGMKYCDAITARSSLITDKGWTIIGDELDVDCVDGFVTTWKTDNTGTSNDDQISIPATGTYDIYWERISNNSTFGRESQVSGQYALTFPSAGTYRVVISNTLDQITFANGGDALKLLSVDKWGNTPWTSMANAFEGCANVTVTAADAPNLSNTTNLTAMFKNCSIMNGEIGHWDVSTIANMQGLFYGASSFNQDISAWDVRNVATMENMFRDAVAFDQPIGSWNTNSAQNMQSLFYGATSFNQDISQWNTTFVFTMENMFRDATAFNQDISGWNMAGVHILRYMFGNATAFDQPIGSWNTGSATNMGSLFEGASSFNQDISGWNTVNVEFMGFMFKDATVFDQDISAWNTNSATKMASMFENATAFDQNLGNWNISSVTDMTNMLDNTGLSTQNYDSTLNGWMTQSVQNGIILDAQSQSYCEGEIARDYLINTFGWTVNGDTKDMTCTYVEVALDAFLQAAALDPNTGEETLMRDDLRTEGVLPIISTYSDAAKSNTLVLDTTGNDAIVDWILVELRDATDNTLIVQEKSALLQRDGDIVALDGTSGLRFYGVPSGSYHIALKHRNHLGIMTADAFSLSEVATNIDFSDANNPITYGVHAQTSFGMLSNTIGMWAGDVNDDGQVVFLNTGAESVDIKQRVLDVSAIESPFGASVFYKPQGYYDEDTNMDGEVVFLNAGNELLFIKDNVLAHPQNQIFNSVFYKILQQLP